MNDEICKHVRELRIGAIVADRVPNAAGFNESVADFCEQLAGVESPAIDHRRTELAALSATAKLSTFATIELVRAVLDRCDEIESVWDDAQTSVSERIKLANTDHSKARSMASKGLKSQGHSRDTGTMVRAPVGSAIASRQFEHALANSPVVREAQQAIKDLRAESKSIEHEEARFTQAVAAVDAWLESTVLKLAG